MNTLQDKHIAVIVGGPSTEAEVSRRTGTAIAGALQEKGYHAELLELVPDKLASQLKEKILISFLMLSMVIMGKTAFCRDCVK